MHNVKENIFISNRGNGEILALSINDEDKFYFRISGIAAKILLAIQQKNDLKKTIENILYEYEVSEEHLNQDVDKFLKFLIKNDIIE